VLAQILKCAAEFSLADHLSAGPRSPESVAAAAGLDARATRRLLRYCSTVGLTAAEEDGTYRATPLLAALKSDDPLSLRDFALAQKRFRAVARLGRLDDAFRTGCRRPKPPWAAASSITFVAKSTYSEMVL
jgi:hypothetical protein